MEELPQLSSNEVNEVTNSIKNVIKEETLGVIQFKIDFGEKTCFLHFPTFVPHYLSTLTQYAGYSKEVSNIQSFVILVRIILNNLI